MRDDFKAKQHVLNSLLNRQPVKENEHRNDSSENAPATRQK